MRTLRRHSLRTWLRHFVCCVASCSLLLMPQLVSVGYSQTDENRLARGNQIKAAFLYYVMKFTDWDERSDKDSEGFTLCLVGDPGVSEKAEIVLDGKLINQKPIALHFYKKVEQDEPSFLFECHGAFFGVDTLPSGELLRNLAQRDVLTIGENDGFLSQGGMIHIFEIDNRIKFDVNLFSLKLSNLRISSDMLQLARHIRGKGEAP